MAVKKALEELNKAFQDLSSLHVQTFTGKVDFNATGKGIADIEKAIAKATTDAKISLVPESMYKFDGDSYNFVTNDEGGIPSSALELHKASVEGGVATRHGLMQLVKGIFD